MTFEICSIRVRICAEDFEENVSKLAGAGEGGSIDESCLIRCFCVTLHKQSLQFPHRGFSRLPPTLRSESLHWCLMNCTTRTHESLRKVRPDSASTRTPS